MPLTGLTRKQAITNLLEGHPPSEHLFVIALYRGISSPKDLAELCKINQQQMSILVSRYLIALGVTQQEIDDATS